MDADAEHDSDEEMLDETVVHDPAVVIPPAIPPPTTSNETPVEQPHTVTVTAAPTPTTPTPACFDLNVSMMPHVNYNHLAGKWEITKITTRDVHRLSNEELREVVLRSYGLGNGMEHVIATEQYSEVAAIISGDLPEECPYRLAEVDEKGNVHRGEKLMNFGHF
ncbi:hypothetical protein AAF712_012480 [Marasmius tenuissimus]|uniref:Uncharacterized protein n=1 Tax=Marasmius tenuissimus TaxID=585030 RepID=A0ABR2ZHG5_9AGAR